MSDSHDKSDDLIAELAKLMASGAAGGENAPKPAVIKLPPLDEATIKAAPVRIPGMDAPVFPKNENAGGPPPVRIPGMDRPPGVDAVPTAPAPRPGAQFDLGKPAAAPVMKAEPAASAPPPPPEPKPFPPPPAASPSALRFDPVRFGPVPSPVPPPPARHEPEPAAPPHRPNEPRAEASTAGSGHSGADNSGADNESDADDPIAMLIAKELDGETRISMPAASGQAAPQPVTAAPVQARAHVEPHSTVVPMKPLGSPSRQPESDRFGAAPPFGNGERKAPTITAHTSRDEEPDPMDEIENLIGEAVRVELSTPDNKPSDELAPAPVVPPLSSAFGPRRTGLRDKEPQVESAEAAIMAAAAASGGRGDQVDSPAAEDRPYRRMRVKPPRTSGIPGGMRQYVGIAVAGTLLLASGFGLYWVLGMNRGEPTEAPVLTADASPAKVQPVTPVVAPEPTSGSVVFDEIDGVADAGEAEEELVSRDATEGATATEVARAVPPAADAGDDDTLVADTGLANRKVRTVTVRPDGTIVASDDTVAGTSELPVERPNVPEIAGADVEPSELLTAAVAETRTPSDEPLVSGTTGPLSSLVAETPADSTPATELETPAPIDVAALTPAEEETPAVFDGSLVAPVPMPRPFSREAMVGGGATAGFDFAAAPAQPVDLVPTPVASATGGPNAPASTPLTALTSPEQPAASQVTSRGGAYVQLSSQRSEADASSSLRAVQSRLGGLLNGAPLEIRRVDLGAKGIWYRVVMPVDSFQDATQSCATIKANGGDCVAING